MNGQPLRTRAALAGTVAAAAAGALTVGLISGVVHSSTQAQGTTNTSTSSTSSGSGSGSEDDDSSNGSTASTSGSNSTGGLSSAGQNQAPQAGSHGS